VSRLGGRGSGLPKYLQVAGNVRAEIEMGSLLPGASAPSGAALARTTGFSQLTCRKALHLLIKDGVLVPGPSPNAQPRVACPAHDEQTAIDAERGLSSALASRRRSAGMTQIELAAIVGVSVTTVGHAETGRLWQSRGFWERADKALGAHGLLLRRHDDYRAAAASSASDYEAESGDTLAADADPAPVGVACITITWADGTKTTVHPPAHTAARGIAISESHGTSREGAPRP
jgi:DNA-binding transcriptional MocR family regulator